jgi:selenocysteine-specific elongation factor
MRIIATAGHVDHGKSSLVRALTGTDPDRWVEERERGLTIDLGFAHFATPGGNTVSFIDVPGHTRFISNMLAGVGGVSACLLVIDAHEGWKPQTEEHLRILDLLGISGGVVALTKSDLCTSDEIRATTEAVRTHLRGTRLADASIVPVSSITRHGLDDLVDRVDELLSTAPGALDRGRPRLFVDRVFAAKGSGTVVTGTLTDGVLHVGERVISRPEGIEARVRSMQSHGHAVESVPPGSRVALNLSGVEHHALRRGSVIVAPEQWHLSSQFDASLTTVPILDHAVTSRGAWSLHIGSDELSVRIRLIGGSRIEAGSSGLVRVRLPYAMPLLPGDRYILRESGRRETVGGGEVLDIDPVLPVARAHPDKNVNRVIEERGWITAEHLRLISDESRPPVVGEWIVDTALLAASRHAIEERVAASGAEGLRLDELDERQRLVLSTCAGIEIVDGVARTRGIADPLADHPAVAALAAGGCAPSQPTGISNADLRILQRRGLVFERDGEWFHVSALETARRVARDLLANSPGGFTMSQFRETLGNTRKHAVPLATELDARGITRRRGDVRIAGPRLDG